MNGLMQDHPLTLTTLLRRIPRHHPDRVVVDAQGRTTWGEVAERALRLMAALRRLGVKPGDRVASFAWNSRRHLELYLAVPCLGAVLHTLNIRSHPDTLAGIIRSAGDRLVFVDASLTERFAPVRGALDPDVRYVVLDDGEPGPAFVAYQCRVDLSRADLGYEALIAGEPDPAEPPELDERSAALLCHTSGTTGTPKGVLYSHRSQLLHTFGVCAADGFAVREADTILLLAPMFHVNGWGLPYAAALTGASLVMTGAGTDPETILRTIDEERVTLAAAVPTVWVGVADHLDAHSSDLSSLRALLIGGAAPGRDLIRRYAEHGVPVMQGWGMTETSPNASLTRIRPGFSDTPELRATQGVAVPGVEVRICADDGGELPWDGSTVGELEVRGPWVASGYLGAGPAEQAAAFHDGWLRTGDVATIDRHGYIRVVDRIKDLVKSGGEWISSTELEDLLTTHPGVREAAVVAVPHPHWGERPVALVVTGDASVTTDDLAEHLTGRVPNWWLPDDYVFCPEIPRTAVGKYDKRLIRAYLRANRTGRAPAPPSRRQHPDQPGPRRVTNPAPQRSGSDRVEAGTDGR